MTATRSLRLEGKPSRLPFALMCAIAAPSHRLSLSTAAKVASAEDRGPTVDGGSAAMLHATLPKRTSRPEAAHQRVCVFTLPTAVNRRSSTTSPLGCQSTGGQKKRLSGRILCTELNMPRLSQLATSTLLIYCDCEHRAITPAGVKLSLVIFGSSLRWAGRPKL